MGLIPGIIIGLCIGGIAWMLVKIIDGLESWSHRVKK